MIDDIPKPLLRKIRPRRAIPGSAKAPSKRAVASLRKQMAKRQPRVYLKVLTKGIGDGPEPALAELQAAGIALVKDLTPEGIREASIDVLAASVVLVRRAGERQSLLPSIVVSRGLSDAIEVAVRGRSLSLDAASGGWMTSVYLVSGPPPHRFHQQDDLPLRHAVCAADDDEYGRGRATAQRLRPDLALLERAYVSHLFPDEPWADEDLRQLLDANDPHFDRYGNLLTAAEDPALLVELCARYPHGVGVFALDVACGVGEDAIGVLASTLPTMLVKPKYGPLMKTPPRTVATALGLIGGERVAQILAPHLGSAVLGPVVTSFFQDNPELSHVLETHATGRRAKATAAAIAASAARSHDVSPEADDEEIPSILKQRPWRQKPAAATEVVPDVEIPDDVVERVELQSPPAHGRWESDARDMTPEELSEWRARLRGPRHHAAADFDYIYRRGGTGYYLRVPTRDGIEAWNEGEAHVAGRELAWVSAHGLAVMPGFVARHTLGHLDYEGAEEHFDALTSFISPTLAPLVARIASRRKKFRPAAERWLLRHADDVVIGLIPPAVGPAGPLRTEAELALSMLSRAGARSAVEAAARVLGDDVVRVIGELLDRDPLPIGKKPIKLPSFLRQDALPTVRSRRGHRLPDDATSVLIEMLSVVPADYPGAALVADALDHESLQAFAGALFDQWVLGDAPGRHDWMLLACVRFPSESTTRRISECARQWARNKKVKAHRACAALAAIGTDQALLHLGHIAETSRFADLRDATRALLDDAAAQRGLSPEELGDRTVPDLGLGEDGKLRLSFGSRIFTIDLDESLAVVVRGEDGAVRASLPRTRKTDDPAAAKAARDRLKVLKKDVTAIADRQIRRLERAMVDGRRWTRDEFVALVVSHPVLMHLARGLVFEAQAPKAEPRAFRVSEDGSFANVDDDAFELDAGAQVRIAHPARRALEAKWTTRFADYELVQPFEQLGRAVFEAKGQEASADVCRRAEGHEIAPQKLLGLLESRGYRRDQRGFPRAFVKRFVGGAEAEIPFLPGIEIAYLKSAEEQIIGSAFFRAEGGRPLLSEVDAVAFSELVRDLEALRAT